MREIENDFEPTLNQTIEAATYCSSIHQYCEGCVFADAHDDGFPCEEHFAEYLIKILQEKKAYDDYVDDYYDNYCKPYND